MTAARSARVVEARRCRYAWTLRKIRPVRALAERIPFNNQSVSVRHCVCIWHCVCIVLFGNEKFIIPRCCSCAFKIAVTNMST